VRVPIEELVDLAALEERDGRPPSPARLRDALPKGWVLDEDGRSARRDLRLFFRDGWVLLLGLVSFGAAGLGIFWYSFPRGLAGFVRLGVLVLVLLLVGGLVAPWITRRLNKR
jgi:hypothetical protein